MTFHSLCDNVHDDYETDELELPKTRLCRMSRHLLKRTLKYLTVGGLGTGSGYFLYKNDWEVSTIGVVRFGRAAFTAFWIVADYKIHLRGIDNESPEYEKVKSEIHCRSALRLRELCCSNGGGYIKVGQHVGSLEYLLPMEYVETMKVLHNQAPQTPVTELFKVLEEDLGQKVQDMFVQIDPEPLGAASLAQVHKATLKDGTVVAVKIQHPKVKKHSFVDIKTMELLVHGVAFVFPGFQYKWLAEETKRNLPLELDFLHEGRNCERVQRLFKHFKFLKIPKIYWDLSSERVLTMEFCEGGKVDNREYMKQHKISVDEVSRDLGKLYSEMIFVHGYVHCDPHPGNVLVNKTAEGNTEIVLLDHGIYQSLTDEFRVNYCKLWTSLIKADLEGIKKYSTAMNAGDMYPLFACMLTARSWKAISSGIDKQQYTKSEDDEIKSNAANYLIQISEILNRVPRQLLLILKTNDVLRSIEYTLQTRASSTSFINMSRCCIRAVAMDSERKCNTWTGWLQIRLAKQWQLFKINIYEFFLWVQTSSVVRFMSRKNNVIAL
ncbi:aarF domain-containing protein kinase 1-like [Mytilus californianus]|uniref:aarF domain-containing protein kinase 1-like n=1 Tax=Mytilus californianus TaxID=6549 RepID=UPI0022450B74|nr:aarF domain-containing protein kinase 1-like [Mytilus californianus]